MKLLTFLILLGLTLSVRMRTKKLRKRSCNGSKNEQPCDIKEDCESRYCNFHHYCEAVSGNGDSCDCDQECSSGKCSFEWRWFKSGYYCEK